MTSVTHRTKARELEREVRRIKTALEAAEREAEAARHKAATLAKRADANRLQVELCEVWSCLDPPLCAGFWAGSR